MLRRGATLRRALRRPRRPLCAGADPDAALEAAQLASIKPEAFYDAQAARRNYFYYVDLQGRLFLEDCVPKNIATSLKSAKFLDFFWRQLRPNSGDSPFAEYPFASPCGREMNFVKVADRPVVFQELAGDELVFAGSLRTPFDPASLALSPEGRLYHPVRHKRLGHELGLVKSHLAMQLCSAEGSLAIAEDGVGELEFRGEVYRLGSVE